jgi:tetratricopeptide (TPR) repeat protein
MSELTCSTNKIQPGESPRSAPHTRRGEFAGELTQSADALLKSSWRKIADGNGAAAAATFTEAVTEAHKQYREEPEKLAFVLKEASAGIFLASPTYAQKSIAYLSRAIRLQRKIDGGSSMQAARLLRQMSAVYASCKMYEEALDCLRRSADILEAHAENELLEFDPDKPLNREWRFGHMEQFAFSRANNVPLRFSPTPV